MPTVNADTVAAPIGSSAPWSLRTNISWSFVGLAGYAASQWGMLVVLARLTSPDIVGQFTISLAFTGPIMLLAGLDLRLVQAADASRKFAFSDYLGLRLITSFLAFVVITALNVALGYEAEVSMVIVAMAVAKSFELQSDAFHGLFQQRERMDLFAQSLLARGVASLVLFAAAMYLTQSLTVGVIALSASSLIVLLQRDVPNSMRFLPGGWTGLLRARLESKQLMQLFLTAFPAGLRAFLVSLEAALPSFFIQRYHGDHAVGSFAALAYSLVVVMTFARSLNQPAVPRMAALAIQGNSTAFHSLWRRLCVLGSVLGIVGLIGVIVAGRPFLSIAYGQSYADQYPILIILMVATAIRLVALPIAAALAALNCFTSLLVTQVVAVLFLACISEVLVPSQGLHGAAYAVSLVSLVMLLGHLVLAAVMLPGVLEKQGEQSRFTQMTERLPSAA